MKIRHGWNRRTGPCKLITEPVTPEQIILIRTAERRPTATNTDSIAVLWPSGRLAYRASPAQARALIRNRFGIGLGPKKQSFTSVRLTAGPGKPDGQTKYTTRAESSTNPQNVLTLKRLPKSLRSIFGQVALDCIVPYSQ